MEIWDKVLDALKEQVSEQVFSAWISPLRPAGPIRGSELEILVGNDFSLDWVKSRYDSLLTASFSAEAGRAITIVYTIDTNAPIKPAQEDNAKSAEQKDTPETPKQAAKPKQADPSDESTTLPRESGLDPRYTFDSFVVGGCNQFVHAASERVAEAPATAYNPLFIYGGVGLGKTHLMHAIGHKVLEDRPDARVLYISSEKFMTELINSLRFKRVFNFKEEFRSVDLLLIDDIQFIAGKKATQEEFFHTFNALFEANKQIIMTSDRFPNEIDNLEERLRSRFGWGLVADIQPPELETRVAILKKKASMEGLELQDDVAFFLANAIQTNVRELEGALVRVSAFSSLTRQPVTMELVKESLRDIVKGQERQITIEGIQKTVCAFYKIRPQDMRSNKRSRLFAHPRQIAMYLCKQLTRHSYPEVGHQFGGRDHTTVLYAVRSIDKKMKSDGNLAEEVETLKNMITK
ncbi:MAG: chromosomal replication initiator protein DnaA [Magnetococcales bacterium]|nr:chromosomal replication initiator protein DnaA [Magnetococcales bacterium]